MAGQFLSSSDFINFIEGMKIGKDTILGIIKAK